MCLVPRIAALACERGGELSAAVLGTVVGACGSLIQRASLKILTESADGFLSPLAVNSAKR